ncbi:hypothetical protein D3C72_1335990 [compost metagenome]
MPLRGRTGKDEGLAAGLAQIRIHGQGQAHVHGIAQRVADDGVRAVHAPRKTIPRGRVEQPVFLLIVKILDRLPALLFAERRDGHAALAIGVERSQVVLEASDQRRMAQVAGGAQRGQHIGDHGAIDADVFLLVGLARPGREKDVAGIQARQGGADRRAIRGIERQACATGGNRRAATRDARHLPALRQQVRGQIAADNAAGADNQCVLVHGCSSACVKSHDIADRNSYQR